VSAEAPPPRNLADYERAYGESGFEAVQAGLRKRLLLGLLESVGPRRVLEVGCGTDSLANHWRRADRFVVVEPAPQFAAQARADTTGRADVEVFESTLEAAVEALAGGEPPFDLIVLSSLLHELTDAAPVLRAAAALCGPRTLVHVNVPNAMSLHRLLALEMGLIGDVAELSGLQKRLQQHRTFTAASLEAFVTDLGFEVVERGSYFIKPFAHAQMQQLQEQGFLTQAMLEGLWGLEKHMPGLGSEIYVNLRRGG
jgi:SAM-dependent methyltransferase